ncbi:MAG: hypothetical protein KIT08_07080 [Anaerolineales bacterium]|nr:MAG: hypothetical protein KIT08_07080 [Anaerolineales bacterium]
MSTQWIKASDIGEYLYCQRAWWLRLQGAASANVQELAEGTRQHARHGRGWQLAGTLRVLAIGLAVVAMILLVLQVVG